MTSCGMNFFKVPVLLTYEQQKKIKKIEEGGYPTLYMTNPTKTIMGNVSTTTLVIKTKQITRPREKRKERLWRDNFVLTLLFIT